VEKDFQPSFAKTSNSSFEKEMILKGSATQANA